MELELSVNKANVYDEVAKTTSYLGAKMMGEDAEAYKRIFTTDEDRLFLERFWVETCNSATEHLKPFIVSVDAQPVSHGIDLTRNYKVRLEVSSAFDTSLREAIETTLHSYFVLSIASKWYAFASKSDVEYNATEATGLIEEALKMMYYRKRPMRADYE